MTTEQMKDWIDKAPYLELLRKWRFEPLGSLWFNGEVGGHFQSVIKAKSQAASHDEKVAARKDIGW